MPLNSKNEDCRGPCSCHCRRHFPGEALYRSYPRVRVQDDGRQVVSQAGSVLLVETVRKTGLDQAVSQALTPWRKPRAVHVPARSSWTCRCAPRFGHTEGTSALSWQLITSQHGSDLGFHADRREVSPQPTIPGWWQTPALHALRCGR